MKVFRRVLLSSFVVVMLVACGGSGGLGSTMAATPSPSGQAALPTSTAVGTGSPGDDGPADPTFPCGSGRAGGTSGAAGRLTDVRVGAHGGFDRVVFQFSGDGVPEYALTPQSSAAFLQDGSGQPVNLAGSAGLRVVFHGASGVGSYGGSVDLHSGLPIVEEVRQVGDFERVLSWGVGLSVPACTRVIELSGPSRLVIDLRS